MEYTEKSNNIVKGSRLFWLAGIGFTFFIAILGLGLSKLPGFDHIGPLASAILIAVVFRQVSGYPEKLRSGIEFSSKRLLRFAIILYGLKLNIDIIFHQGLPLLVRGIGSVAFAILVMYALSKWLKADASISLLLGVGTGVCGAAAIAAISTIVKSREEDTAISVGIIALMGTLFSILYTVLLPWLPLSDTEYGTWAGISLHEIAHVALAGAPAGQDALTVALLAKLGRVFLLVPLCFFFMYRMKKRSPEKHEDAAKVEFPWFLIGFIVMSLIGSYILGGVIPVSSRVLDDISNLSTCILTMAMVGLGLNISFHALRDRALRPLAAMTVTSVILSVLAFFTV
ncbi:YeiH family protein [Fictibacillus sp. NRS-1165]|uniref:YeiH family protein n=1 Tax=Fictibacillus sp. NRS-1165 TaxID=3144463 RepID=UPI003D1FBEC5